MPVADELLKSAGFQDANQPQGVIDPSVAPAQAEQPPAVPTDEMPAEPAQGIEPPAAEVAQPLPPEGAI